MSRLCLAGLLFAAIVPFVASAQQPAVSYNDVLLMINDSSANSVDIGNYFALRRNIPAWHVFHFSHDTSTSGDYGETIDSTSFKHQIFWPLEAFMRAHNLVDSINYIVSTKGCPLRVTTPTSSGSYTFPATGSFTDCIALANGADTTFMLINRSNAPGFSRYASSTTPLHFQHNNVSMPYYLTTRLDAYTVDQVKAMILRAETPAFLGQGTYVLDIDPGRWNPSYQEGNYWLQWANDSLHARGLTTIFDTTNVYLTHETSVIGYCSWGSNDGNSGTYAPHAIPGNTYLNGAIAETYVSTGGRSFNPGTGYGQSLIADWIAEGVTGVKGYTDEPYLTVMAEPQYLFSRYADGFNLAESYWSSSPYIAWRQVVIGDPKMTLRQPAVVSADGFDFGALERYATVARTFTIRNASTTSLEIKPWAFAEGDSSDFLVTASAPLPRTLSPRDSIRITVTFRPLAYQSLAATLHIPYHLGGITGDQRVAFSLAGVGARPTLGVADTLRFPDVGVGSTTDVSLTLRNEGTADTLSITAMAFSGAPDYSIDHAPTTDVPATILPGDSIAFPVHFAPQDTGLRAATILIHSNATLTFKPTNVALRGRGESPSSVRTVRATISAPSLSAAYPNPFAGATTFTVRVGDDRAATIKIYDLMGRVVEDMTPQLGRRGGLVEFRGAALPAGAYVCRLVANGAVSEQMLVKSR